MGQISSYLYKSEIDQIINNIKFNTIAILVKYVPGKKWHKWEYLFIQEYIFNKNYEFTKTIIKDYNKIIIFKNLKDFFNNNIILSEDDNYSFKNSDTSYPYTISHYDNDPLIKKGWIEIEDNSNIYHRLYDIEVIHLDKKDLYFLKYIETINSLGLDKNSKKFYFFDIDFKTIMYEEFLLGYNKLLHQLTDPLIFEEKEYPFHLSHATSKENIIDIIKSDKLCIDENCKEIFDEKTGLYLYNEDYKSNMSLGIYMELFYHYKVKPCMEPMSLEDNFYHFRFISVDESASKKYGEIGFIFPFEEIFGKYKVSLKKNKFIRKIENITLDQYVYNFGGEYVIRANSIPLKKAFAFYVKFTFTEIDYIYDKLYMTNRKQNLKDNKLATLLDVINLYLSEDESIPKKRPWYVRKSALFKLLEAYNIKNINSNNLSKLPKIYAVTAGKGRYISWCDISLYKNPIEDIKSDWDEFNPNDE